MKRKKLFAVLVAVIMMLVTVTGCTSGEGVSADKAKVYPEKTITIVNPYGAGGGTDVFTRQLATILEKDLGQSVVVVNKPGGSGATGTAEVANADNDGYTLLVNDKALLSSYHMGVSQTKWDELEPISRSAIANYVIVTGADSPYNTMEELIEAAKAAPNTLSIGVSGIGGMSHLVSETLLSVAEAPIKVIGFDGGSDTKAAVVGGQIQCASLQIGEVMPLVESGDVRVLGVVQEERNSQLPEVPTLKEQGIDCTLDQYWVFYAPKGTDQEIIKVVSSALERAMATDEFKDFAKKNYYSLGWLSTDDTIKALEEQDQFLKNIIDSVGLASN